MVAPWIVSIVMCGAALFFAFQGNIDRALLGMIAAGVWALIAQREAKG